MSMGLYLRVAAISLTLLACGKGEPSNTAGGPAAPATKPAATLARVDAGGDIVTVVPKGAPAALGQDALVHVHVQPAPGFHINTDGFPHALKLRVPDGVACDKSELADSDAKIAADALDWALRYKVTAAGEKTLDATLSVGVCNESGCVPKTIQVSWKTPVP